MSTLELNNACVKLMGVKLNPGLALMYVTDDRPYMIILDLIRPFRSYMVRPYMV